MNRRTTSERVQIIRALVQGSSINSIVWMTGRRKVTILKLLLDVGGCATTTGIRPGAARTTVNVDWKGNCWT